MGGSNECGPQFYAETPPRPPRGIDGDEEGSDRDQSEETEGNGRRHAKLRRNFSMIERSCARNGCCVQAQLTDMSGASASEVSSRVQAILKNLKVWSLLPGEACRSCRCAPAWHLDGLIYSVSSLSPSVMTEDFKSAVEAATAGQSAAGGRSRGCHLQRTARYFRGRSLTPRGELTGRHCRRIVLCCVSGAADEKDKLALNNEQLGLDNKGDPARADGG